MHSSLSRVPASPSSPHQLYRLLALISLLLLLVGTTAEVRAQPSAGVTAEVTAMQLGNTVTYSIMLRSSAPTDTGTVFLAGSVPAVGSFRRQEITPAGALPRGYVADESNQQSVVWLVENVAPGQTMGPFTYQVDVPGDVDPSAAAAHAFVSWDRPAGSTFQSPDVAPLPPGAPGGEPVTPETPNGTTLRPAADADGVKRVTLTASVVNQEFLNTEGKQVMAKAYGFNGGSPGPTLVFTIGDTVEITVVNNLPEPTSVHWHGVIVPNTMDGVPEAGQPSPKIQTGGSFTYRFTVQQEGTHMYHSHTDTAKQDLLGLAGGLIFLPKQETGPKVARDIVYFLNEWTMPQDLKPDAIKDMPRTGSPVDAVNSVMAMPNWANMNFNFFTMNGRSFPNTAPLDITMGQRVRLRFFNVGMSTHPIHLHGQDFLHTEQDGNAIAPDNQLQLNTITVAPGQTQAVEFYAVNPGIWPLHCHLAHHVTNNLSSGFGGMSTVVRISP